MKKNSLLVLGLATLTALGLASCGTKEKTYSNVGTEITVWATAKEEAVITTIVDKYNEKQKEDSSKFKVKVKAVAEGDTGTTLLKDPQVKDAPALFLCADDHISGLATRGIALEVKGSYKDDIVKNSSEVAVKGVTYGDKLYGFPVTSDNGYFLWYNGSVLQDADVSNLQALLAKAKSLGKKVLFDAPNGWYALSFFASPDLCGVNSIKYAVNGEGKASYECNWDSDAAAASIAKLSTDLVPYYADGTLVTGSNDAIIAGFQNKSMIAAVSGTWMENDLVTAIDGETLKATKLPTYTGAENKEIQLGSFTGSKVYCINRTRPVEEQKAAAALAELLTNKESQLIRFEKRQSIPCNNEAIKDARYTENVSIGAKALGEQNKFASVQSQCAQDRYWDVGAALGQAIIDGKLAEEGQTSTWAEFLKKEIDILRQAQ